MHVLWCAVGVCVYWGLFRGRSGCFSFVTPPHPAVGPKTSQFLAALMGRSGLGKHRSSPLRCGRVVQSSSKGGDWPQVGWLSVIAMETTSTCVVTSATHIASDSTSESVCVCVLLCVSHRMASSSSHEELLRSPPSGSLSSATCAAPSSNIDFIRLVLFPISSHMTVVSLQPEKLFHS